MPNYMAVALIVSENNGNITFFTFDLTFLTLTLGVGHCDAYILKRVVTKYNCAKFGDCSFNSFQEK